MAYACIDVGSNTTRLLVAELRAGSLREITSDRAFTRLGKALLAEGVIPPDKIEEAARVVAAQAALARDLGVTAVDLVGTAVVRDAPNRAELEAAVADAAGVQMRVLSGEEEARLAFVGAAATLPGGVNGRLVVVDVGGWSTEVVMGTPAAGVSWSESFRVGSGLLTDVYLRSDPPGRRELAAVTAHVSEGVRAAPTCRAPSGRWRWGAAPPRCGAWWEPSSAAPRWSARSSFCRGRPVTRWRRESTSTPSGCA